MAETKACPFCAEDILAAAIKCKHCGELVDTPQDSTPSDPSGRWRWSKGTNSWICNTHNGAACQACAPKPGATTSASHKCPECSASYATSERLSQHMEQHKPAVVRKKDVKGERLSVVADRTIGEVACPVCKGTNFESKRSAFGKVTAGILATKRRVKCITCGTEYFRG